MFITMVFGGLCMAHHPDCAIARVQPLNMQHYVLKVVDVTTEINPTREQVSWSQVRFPGQIQKPLTYQQQQLSLRNPLITLHIEEAFQSSIFVFLKSLPDLTLYYKKINMDIPNFWFCSACTIKSKNLHKNFLLFTVLLP